MFTLQARVKDFFFDRAQVHAMMERRTRRALSEQGGYIRKTASNSIKKHGAARSRPKKGKALIRWQDELRRRPASQPGNPPHAHSSDSFATLRNILYFYDPARETVVIGPRGLRQTIDGEPDTVPGLMEFGGRQRLVEVFWGGQWRPRSGKRRPRNLPTRTRVARYPQRPFMGPALLKATDRFPGLVARVSG